VGGEDPAALGHRASERDQLVGRQVRIASSSAGDALPGRFGIAFSRTVPAPTSAATFGEMPRRSIQSRYPPSVSHSIRYWIARCRFCDAFFMPGVIGPIERSPRMSSVTPCLIALWARPSAIRLWCDCESTSMKPGATASPPASSSTSAVEPGGTTPTATTRSPRTAMSPAAAGRPEPSYTIPPRTSRS
jgi:hypothetical protein